jgi:PAS domain S-box-containing protein
MNRNPSFPVGIDVGAEFSLSRAILTLAPLLVAFLVQLMIWPIIRPFAWSLFIPAVFLSAWIGGRLIGSLATVVATLLIWYFFLSPERSFVVRDVGDIVAALTFLGTGVLFSLFHDRLKRANLKVAEAMAANRYQAQLESVHQTIQVVEDAKLRQAALRADVSAALAEPVGSLQSILQRNAEAVVRHLDAAFARIWTLNQQESMLELQASAGLYTHLNGSHSRVPVGKLKIGLIAEERQPHMTNDVRTDPRISDQEWARDQGMVSFAGYPLLVEDRVVGVIAMFARHPLTEDTVEALASVAATIAQGIERKRAEEALRESQEILRLFIEHAPAALAMFDREMRYLAVSNRWIVDYHLGDADIIGRSHYDVFPEIPERWKAVHHRALEGEILRADEDRFVRADGTVQWVWWEVRPWYAADGAIGGIVIFAEDITEWKLVEEALRESELRFRIMISAIPNLSYETDGDGVNIFTSDQWRAYTGMTAEESAGAGFIRAYHPDEADDVLAQWRAAVRSGMSFERKCRIRAAGGSYRWFLNRAQPGRDAEGRIVRWAGSLTDIDDLVRAEEALRESKERLAGIVSSAMDAIITVDEDQRVVLFNEAAERMFGCRAAEALGQPFNRFIPERFRGAHTELVRRFGETGGASRAMRSLTALRADGTEFPIEAAISKVEVGGRKLYTLIHRDITERKQAEAEREQLALEQSARAAAEAANRSKDEFLAMVSHELRSPLNAILGYTRILRSGPVDQDAINNVTAIVERNAKAQLQIIEDLLDSARIITGKLRIERALVDLAPVLEAALDTVRSAAEAKGVTLGADFGALPEQVLGDSTRLQQVVWNLLTNAVKFTPEGGRVELRMEGALDNVQIMVSDTGKGIEPEFLPFVFDSFRQADSSSVRRFGGLGLGLSLVKNLVELHGGTITASSEGEGRGATFTVMLPRRQLEFIEPPALAVAPLEARIEDSVAMDRELWLEGVSVLVVDDQEDAREMLIQALSEYGAQVTAVSSGAEALAYLSDPPGGKRPDALVLDIAMPNEDGYTALKRVRALEAEQGATADKIPAIALTAYGRSEDRLRALRAGFQMHVAKPVEPAELAVVIASLTTRRAWERERKG